MKRFISFLLFIILCNAVSAEDLWVVKTIQIDIDGNTKEGPFRSFFPIEEEDSFTSQEDLNIAIEAAREAINNNRIFKEGSIVEAVELSRQDNIIPVVITVRVSDSFNLIFLPYGQYDSNTGVELSLKLRNYNFLGYMNTLTMDFEYIQDDDALIFSFFLPINNLELQFDYEVIDEGRTDLTQQLFFSTAYKWTIPILDHDFYLKATEGIYVLPNDLNENLYLKSDLQFSSSWDIPWVVYASYKPVYTAELNTFVSYLPTLVDPISEDRDGLYTKFTHSFSLGAANWGDNNYRDGILYKTGNFFQYHFDTDKTFYNRWSGDLWGTVELYKDWYPFGLALRLHGTHDLFRRDNREEYFRGILTADNIESRGGLFMNSALYLTVWNWDPVWEWYGGPTIDVGYLYDVPDGQDNLVFTAGLEGLAFPYVFRSLFARMSLGFDIKGLEESETSGMERFTENWEFYFGLGAFY